MVKVTLFVNMPGTRERSSSEFADGPHLLGLILGLPLGLLPTWLPLGLLPTMSDLFYCSRRLENAFSGSLNELLSQQY